MAVGNAFICWVHVFLKHPVSIYAKGFLTELHVRGLTLLLGDKNLTTCILYTQHPISTRPSIESTPKTCQGEKEEGVWLAQMQDRKVRHALRSTSFGTGFQSSVFHLICFSLLVTDENSESDSDTEEKLKGERKAMCGRQEKYAIWPLSKAL